jgi:hypothetical protein
MVRAVRVSRDERAGRARRATLDGGARSGGRGRPDPPADLLRLANYGALLATLARAAERSLLWVSKGFLFRAPLKPPHATACLGAPAVQAPCLGRRDWAACRHRWRATTQESVGGSSLFYRAPACADCFNEQTAIDESYWGAPTLGAGMSGSPDGRQTHGQRATDLMSRICVHPQRLRSQSTCASGCERSFGVQQLEAATLTRTTVNSPRRGSR